MASATPYPFPIILTRDLPLSNTSLGSNDAILIVRNNQQTERLAGDVLPDTNKVYLTMQDTAPAEFSSIGSPGSITWDTSGVYTYTDGTWGKSPRVLYHWEDYTPTTRFVLVDKLQELSDEEKKTGRENLGIDEATDTVPGIVRIASAVSDADDGVLTAAMFAAYMQLFSIPQATTETAGAVKLAKAVAETDEGVITAAQIVSYIKAQQESIEHATTTTYGTVRLALTISQTDTGVATAAQVANYFNNLPHATDSRYGTVILDNTVEENGTGVVTSGTLYRFIKESGVAVEHATTEKFGSVRLAEEINDTDEGVPTAKQVAAYVGTKSADLSNYHGPVRIVGPDDVELFVYDPETKELRIGVGVSKITIQADTIVNQDSDGTTVTEISN